MIKISLKCAHWVGKGCSYQKIPISKLASSLKKKFDLNQTCKILLTQNQYFWKLYTTE